MLRALPLLLFFSAPALAGPFAVTVTGTDRDQADVVCTVPVPAGDPVAVTALKLPDGKLVPAQTLKPGLLDRTDARQVIRFVLPMLKAGETVTLSPADAPPGTPVFVTNGERIGYRAGSGGEAVPVLVLVRPARFVPAEKKEKQDTETANPTSKPFHHLYDSTGKVRLTNGADGRYPHHRGIYFGFNRVSYDGKTADVWHCRSGAHQLAVGAAVVEAGPVSGRHQLGVDWVGQDGKAFVREDREVAVSRIGTGTLVEFASVVKTVPGGPAKVRLDGDPQHAGFHFRANAEVEKTAKETYFLRPTGKGTKGQEQNWDAKAKSPDAVNRPWTAMSFVLGGKRYTAVYLDHPDNPKEARFSERTYGRFGSYFEYDLTADKPLAVRYRVWVQDGEVTADQCEKLSAAFVAPPKAVAGPPK